MTHAVPCATVHDPPHQLRVGFQVRLVGPHRSEADAQRLDLRPVEGTGGDDGFVASGLQAQGEGDVGVQVAQGAERRQDDPL